MIADGAVWVDGRRTWVASRPVRAGSRVDVYLDPAVCNRLAHESEIDVAGIVLYEDEDLIAVDKPSGLAFQGTVDDDRHHLFAVVRRYLSRRDGSPGARPEPYLSLAHRLDRGISGVQLLSKSRRANAGLVEAFRERRVENLASLGERPTPDSWAVRDRLALRREGSGRRRAMSVDSGGRAAETRFRVRERLRGAVLVEAMPKTGRTHQIRVHLAGSGVPVVGDQLYGARRAPIRAPRPMLHAASLCLKHPVTGETLAHRVSVARGFRLPD